MENKPTDTNSQDETKWNREQPVEQHRELNEGFSKKNLPADYDPSQMKSETEIDEQGNIKQVERARFTDHAGEQTSDETGKNETGNEQIEKLAQNRDRNYDSNPERYPPSHPDNHKNRGNIELDEK